MLRLSNCARFNRLKCFFNDGKEKNAKINPQTHSSGKSPNPPGSFRFKEAKRINR